jgi:hypothetical protein
MFWCEEVRSPDTYSTGMTLISYMFWCEEVRSPDTYSIRLTTLILSGLSHPPYPIELLELLKGRELVEVV